MQSLSGKVSPLYLFLLQSSTVVFRFEGYYLPLPVQSRAYTTFLFPFPITLRNKGNIFPNFTKVYRGNLT